MVSFFNNKLNFYGLGVGLGVGVVIAGNSNGRTLGIVGSVVLIFANSKSHISSIFHIRLIALHALLKAFQNIWKQSQTKSRQVAAASLNNPVKKLVAHVTIEAGTLRNFCLFVQVFTALLIAVFMSLVLSHNLVPKFRALNNAVLPVSTIAFHAVFNARGTTARVFNVPFRASFR